MQEPNEIRPAAADPVGRIVSLRKAASHRRWDFAAASRQQCGQKKVTLGKKP